MCLVVPRESLTRIVEKGAIYISGVAAGRAKTRPGAFWHAYAHLLSCLLLCSIPLAWMGSVGFFSGWGGRFVASRAVNDDVDVDGVRVRRACGRAFGDAAGRPWPLISSYHY